MRPPVVGMLVVLVLAGCWGGGGGPPSTSATPSQGPGSLVELDPASGDLGSATLDAATEDVPQRLALAPARLLFRQVEAGASWQGETPGGLGVGDGATQTVRPVAAFALACTEVTQAQWTALATAAGRSGADLAPWLSVVPADAVAVGDLHPACGLSVDLITAVLADFNTRQGAGRARLRLPTAAEWEHACRAGAITPYAWGADESVARVVGHAVVRESGASAGAQPVAGIGALPRSANALGFYDLHGNVWEPIAATSGADAVLRGGSWLDNLHTARAANAIRIDPAIPHACTGLRLVLVR